MADDIVKLARNYAIDEAAGAINPKSAAAILSREVLRLTERVIFLEAQVSSNLYSGPERRLRNRPISTQPAVVE